MSDIILLFVFAVFALIGLKHPVVAFCGYMWTDLIVPHKITYGFLREQPISLLLAVIAISSLLVNFKKIQIPKAKWVFIALILFMLWIALTNTWAMFPALAERKFDIVFKTILMAILMSLIINTKKDVELVLFCLLGSLTFYMFSAGIKTLMGSGGYGARLVAASNNSGFSESSTLATVAVLYMPLIIALTTNKNLLININSKVMRNFGLLLGVATVIGSTARTGLVVLSAYVIVALKNRKKFLSRLSIAGVIALISFSLTPDDWKERMIGFSSPQKMIAESTRVITWKWTWDSAKSHPLGMGFRGFVANKGQLGQYAPAELQDKLEYKMYAYHSIYFEVLGTQGYVGLLIFLFILYRSVKLTNSYSNHETDPWLQHIGKALNHCLVIYAIGGVFIGVAFNPLFFYLVALSLGMSKLNESK